MGFPTFHFILLEMVKKPIHLHGNFAAKKYQQDIYIGLLYRDWTETS